MGSPNSKGERRFWFDDPKIPKPPKAPPPVDEVAPMLREMSRAATERELRKSSGRANAFAIHRPGRTPSGGYLGAEAAAMPGASPYGASGKPRRPPRSTVLGG